MSTTTQKSRSGSVWLIMLLLLIVVVVSLLIGYLSRQQSDAGAETSTTAESGGALLAESSDESEGANATDSEAVSNPEQGAAEGDSGTPPGDTTFSIGDTVVSYGAGIPNTRVYADADADSLVMSVYEDGAGFSVVEPSGEYLAYPVVVDEVEWYRIRTEDGLVGWVPLDNLIPKQ